MKIHSRHLQTQLFILVVLMLLVLGCVPRVEKPVQSVTTIVPSATSPVIQDTSTPSELVSNIVTPTTQQTDQLSLEECIPIEEKMPDDLILSGVWVRGAGKPYLENLEDHTRYEVPLKGGGMFTSYSGDFAVSPDGKYLAYIDSYFNSEFRIEKRVLRIIKSSGHSLPMDYWPVDWQWLIGWIDNRHIAIFTGNKEILILEPFTGEWKKLQQPSWLDNPAYDYSGYEGPFYSPSLSSVLVKPDYSIFELKDFRTGERLYMGNGSPIRWYLDWSADGSILAIGGNVLNVIIDNKQLIEFKTSKLGIDIVESLKLSPDGQKLVFTSDWSGKLFLFDVKQLKIRKLCSDEFNYWRNPIWSPDSRFVVQEAHKPGFEQFDILIDTQQMHAYKLASRDYQHRLVWLANP
jgi:WD40 repeat protein